MIKLISLFAALALAATLPPYASRQPLTKPTIFAPGIISTGDYESHATFSPDGTEIYFLKDSPDFVFWTIFVSHYVHGHWSEPQVAPFSGRYKDADPFITADGLHLYFISDRPAPGKSHHDLDLWMMDKTSAGWSEPRNLGLPVNSDGQEWFPTVAADGTLYFGSDRPGGHGKTDLYRSRFVAGTYTQPENLGGPINTDRDEYEPFIAPDQSFLIFMADNREGRGDCDLYVSYQEHGRWSEPVSLGADVNSMASEYAPRISPDGKYFFWTSTRNQFVKNISGKMMTADYLRRLRSAGNGLGDIYYIDLSALQVTIHQGRGRPIPVLRFVPGAKD